MDNIKEFIEKAIAKIKETPDLLKKFKEDPKGAIKELFGDMDDVSLSAIVAAVKDKLDGDNDNKDDDGKDGGSFLENIKDKLEDSDVVDGIKDKLGDLFKKD